VAEATLEVMTVGEVAQYLRIPRSSIYKLAQDGRIPCRKVGRQWRFVRQAIDEWLGQRGRAGLEAEARTKEAR
jgi:excisionase family DNA binding protein